MMEKNIEGIVGRIKMITVSRRSIEQDKTDILDIPICYGEAVTHIRKASQKKDKQSMFDYTSECSGCPFHVSCINLTMIKLLNQIEGFEHKNNIILSELRKIQYEANDLLRSILKEGKNGQSTRLSK